MLLEPILAMKRQRQGTPLTAPQSKTGSHTRKDNRSLRRTRVPGENTEVLRWKIKQESSYCETVV